MGSMTKSVIIIYLTHFRLRSNPWNGLDVKTKVKPYLVVQQEVLMAAEETWDYFW